MKRISAILILSFFLIFNFFSMTACENNNNILTDNDIPSTGEVNEPVTENKYPLITGMVTAIDRSSFKKVDYTKYRASSYHFEEVGIMEYTEYPELHEALSLLASERLKETKAINKLLKKRASEEIDFSDRDYTGEYYFYNIKSSIARSDSKCFSFIEDFTSYSGGPHASRYSMSHNFNPKTGEEYKLDEVFDDLDKLILMTNEAVLNKLEELGGGYFSADSDQAEADLLVTLKRDFFKKVKGTNEVGNDISYYSPSWVLTGQGVSFVFNPYDIAPYSDGIIEISFTYEELAGIINDGFIGGAVTYAVPVLYETDKIAYDYDHDGKFDNLKLSAEYEVSDTDNTMIIKELTVKKDDLSVTKTCGAYAIDSYIVHMSDGSDYLYVCCQKYYDNYIMIFNITGDYLEYIGIQEGCFATGALTNPAMVYIAERIDILSTYEGVKFHTLLNNGKFKTEDKYYQAHGLKYPMETAVELTLPLCTGEETEGNLSEFYTFPAGTKFNIIQTDGKTFADLEEIGGEHTGRFYVTMPDNPSASYMEQYHKETGLLIKDVFEKLYFAD